MARVLSRRIDKALPDDAQVELVLPPERLAGCVAGELVDRLVDHAAPAGALISEGTATTEELRALA